MAISVHFNPSAIRAHANLTTTDRLLGTSIERMSSGIVLTSSGDDPAGMSMANTMRHQIRGLERATTNAENGVAMLQTAEGAMDEISNILNKARELAIDAANQGVNDPARIQALQAELDELLTSIDRFAVNTQFGSIPLLNGDHAQNQLPSAAKEHYASINQDWTRLPGGMQADSAISIAPASGDLDRDRIQVSFPAATPATTALQGIDQAGTVLDNVAGQSLTLTGPQGSHSVTLGATTTIADLVSIINATQSQHGARAAYDEITGVLTVDSQHFGDSGLMIAADDMTTGATDVGLLDDDTTDPAVNGLRTAGTNQTIDITYTDDGGLNHVVTLTQDGTSTGGLTFTNLAGGPELVAPFSAYEPGAFSLTMHDASDASIGSTMTVTTATFAATRQSTTNFQVGALTGQQINIEIGDMRTGAIGRVASLIPGPYDSLASLRTQGAFVAGDAQIAIDVIDAAIEDVALQRGRLGAVQASSVETTITSLRLSTTNLIDAESRIRDTDFAAESAEFALLNIRLQAATSMMAQANQIPQSILQLLQ